MKFELYQDKKNEFRWRLKARNNRIMADSSEGYKTREGVEKAVNTIVRELIHYQVEIKWL